MYEEIKQVSEYRLLVPLLGLRSLLFPLLGTRFIPTTSTSFPFPLIPKEKATVREKRGAPAHWTSLLVCPATLPPSEFAIDSQLRQVRIHKFVLDLQLDSQFWQGNGPNDDLYSEIAIAMVRLHLILAAHLTSTSIRVLNNRNMVSSLCPTPCSSTFFFSICEHGCAMKLQLHGYESELGY